MKIILIFKFAFASETFSAAQCLLFLNIAPIVGFSITTCCKNKTKNILYAKSCEKCDAIMESKLKVQKFPEIEFPNK